MQVLSKAVDDATLVFSLDELGLLVGVLTELAAGPLAFDDSQWELVRLPPREDVVALRDELLDFLEQP